MIQTSVWISLQSSFVTNMRAAFPPAKRLSVENLFIGLYQLFGVVKLRVRCAKRGRNLATNALVIWRRWLGRPELVAIIGSALGSLIVGSLIERLATHI